MSFFKKIFGKENTSATKAKERLQIIVAHKKMNSDGSYAKYDENNYLENLKEDIVKVIRKYMDVDPNQVQVDLGEKDNCSVLELNLIINREDELKFDD